MNIQIFGNKKSFDSKKAERWFKERRIKFQYIDLPRFGMSQGEYRSVKQRLGFDALVDPESRVYDDFDMAYLSPTEQEQTLLDYPELFRAPIVRNGKNCTVGFCPDIWESWLADEKK